MARPCLPHSWRSRSLGIYAERLAAERALFEKLDVAQLEELAAASQALVDRAMAMVSANARALSSGGSIVGCASGNGDESTGAVAETPIRPDIGEG